MSASYQSLAGRFAMAVAIVLCGRPASLRAQADEEVTVKSNAQDPQGNFLSVSDIVAECVRGPAELNGVKIKEVKTYKSGRVTIACDVADEAQAELVGPEVQRVIESHINQNFLAWPSKTVTVEVKHEVKAPTDPGTKSPVDSGEVVTIQSTLRDLKGMPMSLKDILNTSIWGASDTDSVTCVSATAYRDGRVIIECDTTDQALLEKVRRRVETAIVNHVDAKRITNFTNKVRIDVKSSSRRTVLALLKQGFPGFNIVAAEADATGLIRVQATVPDDAQKARLVQDGGQLLGQALQRGELQWAATGSPRIDATSIIISNMKQTVEEVVRRSIGQGLPGVTIESISPPSELGRVTISIAEKSKQEQARALAETALQAAHAAGNLAWSWSSVKPVVDLAGVSGGGGPGPIRGGITGISPWTRWYYPSVSCGNFSFGCNDWISSCNWTSAYRRGWRCGGCRMNSWATWSEPFICGYSPHFVASPIYSVQSRLVVARAPSITTSSIILAAAESQNNNLGLVSLPTRDSSVEDPAIASEYFADGFHAYWRSDFQEARKHLDRSLECSSRDARAWYYKAFVEIALDDQEAAKVSLGRAIRCERENPEQAALINKSLERVQGELRVRIQAAKALFRPSGQKKSGGELVVK